MLTHDHKDTEESMFKKQSTPLTPFSPRRWLREIVVIALISVGALVWWLNQPDPIEESNAKAEEGDTGFSREAVEERMRAIGYVQ